MPTPRGLPSSFTKYELIAGTHSPLLQSFSSGHTLTLTDNQAETITLEDKNNYEWYLTCLETDPNIIDKQEVPINSNNSTGSSLYIDIHYPLPLCSNDFDKEIFDNMWGTKGQPLAFRVECNPLAHFQTFKWEFGDGSAPQSGQQTTHIYTNLSDPANPYKITVTATDDQNTQYYGIAYIKIINTPKGRLYADEDWAITNTIQADVTVPAGIILIIEPNTQVYVNPDSALLINGNLQVNSGVSIDWAKGMQWKGIHFNNSGNGTIDGAIINHAERGVACASSGDITIQNTVFRFNETGIHCYSGNISIVGCTFSNNTIYGIKEDHANSPWVKTCVFTDNGINYYDTELYGTPLEYLNSLPNTGNEYR